MSTLLDESVADATRLTHSRQSRKETEGAPVRDPSKHICTPHTCPFLVHNSDQTLVCSISGICHGQKSYNDAITSGRSTRLDDNGCQIGRGTGRDRIRRRRNVAGDSKRAMLAAQSLEDEVGYSNEDPASKRACLVVNTESSKHAHPALSPNASPNASTSSSDLPAHLTLHASQRSLRETLTYVRTLNKSNIL